MPLKHPPSSLFLYPYQSQYPICSQALSLWGPSMSVSNIIKCSCPTFLKKTNTTSPPLCSPYHHCCHHYRYRRRCHRHRPACLACSLSFCFVVLRIKPRFARASQVLNHRATHSLLASLSQGFWSSSKFCIYFWSCSLSSSSQLEWHFTCVTLELSPASSKTNMSLLVKWFCEIGSYLCGRRNLEGCIRTNWGKMRKNTNNLRFTVKAWV